MLKRRFRIGINAPRSFRFAQSPRGAGSPQIARSAAGLAQPFFFKILSAGSPAVASADKFLIEVRQPGFSHIWLDYWGD